MEVYGPFLKRAKNFNDEYVFNDPWHNHGQIGYNKKLVERNHKDQYSMAVALVKKS